MRPLLRGLFVALSVVSTSRASRAQAPAAKDTAGEDLINADRPGIADGSRVIRTGQLQLEVGGQHERRGDAGGRTTTLFAPTLVRLGLTSRLEARIESNTVTQERTNSHDDVVTPTTGAAPVLLGFKWALRDANSNRGASLGTIVRVAPASGTGAFRTTHVTGDVRIAMDWDFAPAFSLNPNVGVARLEDSDGQAFGTALAAVTLTYEPTPSWSPFVDMGYQSTEGRGGTWSLILDGGIAYTPHRDIQLDVSAGAGTHGATPPHPFVALGVSVRTSLFHHARLNR